MEYMPYDEVVMYARTIIFLLSLNLVYQFVKDIKAAIFKLIDNLSKE